MLLFWPFWRQVFCIPSKEGLVMMISLDLNLYKQWALGWFYLKAFF